MELQLIGKDLWLFFIEPIVNGLQGFYCFLSAHIVVHFVSLVYTW